MKAEKLMMIIVVVSTLANNIALILMAIITWMDNIGANNGGRDTNDIADLGELLSSLIYFYFKAMTKHSRPSRK